MSDFNQDVHDYIEDTLFEYEDESIRGSEFAEELIESAFGDGYWMEIGYDGAMEYICENYGMADVVFKYQQDSWGQGMNPFENPCSFMLSMLDWGVSEIIARCSTVSSNWDEDIDLTQDVIKAIVEESKSVDLYKIEV